MNNKLIIGKNNLNQIASILTERGRFDKILYVSDIRVDELYGHKIIHQLNLLGNVEKELVHHNSIAFSMELSKRIIANEIEIIVALGGGKVIDVCKYAAYICKVPLMAIPTTAANDGLASPISVLKTKDFRPKSLGCSVPDMILIDTNIIAEGPKELINAGIGDTISNYMALKDWDLACLNGKDKPNGYAYLMSKNAFDMIYNSKFESINNGFIYSLVNSLVLSGIAMDYAGSSRPVSGSEHLFSHALDYFTDVNILHGIQVALGTITMLKLIGSDYSGILKYLAKFDVDVNPGRLGITKKDFVFCLQNAKKMRKNRYTYLNEISLESKLLEKTYDELLEELE